ncbi:hypothetical protein BT63DRAFT_475599 [Microthyrium microscopicum]|uniref:Ricin B lectin domain-containing protein n=1 Tax=Microthyrium microscopicum TaxID=703497 RepID=A0A6A6UNM2_9PEZI|nr:hypothetical protein BT63DRAFT_475599 [Microthyrium microscopicum]
MSGLDSNAWYQITETRVDFNSSLQLSGNAPFFGAEGPNALQFWQFMPVGNGQYALRNLNTGLSKQLGVCYSASELDPSKTQPCMIASTADDSQKWVVSDWGDGTYKITNVGNGTKYNMDCHPGNPVFMSSVTDATPKQPAQHWEVSSRKAINDGAFSTIISSASSTSSASGPASNSASSTSASSSPGSTNSSSSSSSTSQSASSKSGLSTGASAGIGIGVALGVLLLAALGVFFLLRRRRRQKNHPTPAEFDGTVYAKHDEAAQRIPHPVDVKNELYTPPAELPPAEVEVPRYELPAKDIPRTQQTEPRADL